MAHFFKQRIQKHQKQMQRYLRYVLNDHFALILLLLVGGLGFYYSNALKTLPEDFYFGPIIGLFVLIISLHFGSFVSLTKPADVLFLLPKEKQMRTYLSQAFLYSLIFPFAVLLLVVGATMPLLLVTTAMTSGYFFVMLFMMWGLKGSHLELQRYGLFQETKNNSQKLKLLWYIVALGTISASLWGTPWIGLLLSVVQWIGFHEICWKRQENALDWETMIAKEQHRLHRLYQFINLFTDVPEMNAQVKRRKALDGILKKIQPVQKNTYFYLYTHHFIRGTQFSGLYLRLAVIGAFALAWIDTPYLALGIGSLFIYLIGFQLIPLYHQFRYMLLTQLYPINEKQKQVALQKLLRILLFVVAVIFGSISAIVMTSWNDRLFVFLGILAITLLILEMYLPYRLRKSMREF